MRYLLSAGRRRRERRGLKFSRGYTLIEVLISVAIFTSIVTLACAALDQGLKQYQRVAEKGVNFWDNARLLWVSKAFSSIVDYRVETKSAGIYPYFIGNQDMVSFVTSSPFASDVPVVAWVKKEEEPNGSYSLVYYELPVNTMKIEDIEKAYIFEDYKKGKSVAIANDISDLEFSFYGAQERAAALRWSSSYEASRTKRLPVALIVTYADPQTKDRRRLVFSINANGVLKEETAG